MSRSLQHAPRREWIIINCQAVLHHSVSMFWLFGDGKDLKFGSNLPWTNPPSITCLVCVCPWKLNLALHFKNQPPKITCWRALKKPPQPSPARCYERVNLQYSSKYMEREHLAEVVCAHAKQQRQMYPHEVDTRYRSHYYSITPYSHLIHTYSNYGPDALP